jgi:hypothetical protein
MLYSMYKALSHQKHLPWPISVSALHRNFYRPVHYTDACGCLDDLQAVDKMLPADAHTLCSNRTFIQTMSILDMRPSSNPAAPSASSSTSSGSLKKSSNRSGAFHVAIAAGTAVGSSVLAGVFGSREALLNAVVDSSFPMLTTAAAAAAAANEKSEPRSSSEPAAAAVQLSQAIGAAAGAVIPCPAHIRHCVRISAVPPLHNAPIGSSSSSNSLRVLNNSSSSSGTAANKSRAAAHADIIVASVTSNSSSTDGSSISIQADKATAQDTELVASSVAAFSAVSADIYPGLSQHMLLPRSEWLSYMMLTPSIKTLSYMHYLGRVDAYVWANSTGLVKAAVAEQQQQLTGLLLRDISAVDGVDALFAKFVDWQSGQ